MLNYNERKIAEGKAELLVAARYGSEQLNFRQKLERLARLAARNSRSKTNAVHISLNFAPGEKLDQDTLISIAYQYMQGIGFGDQPFLVYQHIDAGHPHLHIATTSIRPDGKRISLHNIGKNQSEATRKQIEKDFGLVRAEAQQKQQADRPAKIIYGKTDTKRAITNVVNYLVNQYNYSNLAELNVLLKQYNVVANRGAEGTRMHAKNGLVYQVLDAKGEEMGVPIKASSIYGQPTLKNLNEKFKKNIVSRQLAKATLKNKLDKTFHMHPGMDKVAFTKKMKEEQVDVVFRENKQGKVFGLNFIDHQTKSVFKGSDVAEHYSASKILSKLKEEQTVILATQPATRTNTGLLDALLPDKELNENADKHFKRKRNKHLL